MSEFIKHLFRLLLLLLSQHFLLYQIPPLHHTAVPVLYFLFSLWLPFQIGRAPLLLLSFITGMLMDFFTKTPGMHAAAMVLIGYLRPFLIALLMPQQGVEFNYREPSAQSMGMVPYISYVAILTLLHHFCLFSIQAFQFGDMSYMWLKTGISWGVSLVLILSIELIFHRKQKFLTNT
ncbi:MAG: rod shape-determining protein MreD [Bacteroidetes bacterium]|nr:rod shape-determining protein MreD [Bacteroidota bacterium]